MFKKLQVLAVLLCTVSYSTAGTVSIGTASARGDIRVDNYLVKSNTTLFDGSVVETGQATADLRLDKDTRITMSTNSLATLYRDHLVLQRGKGELAGPTSFQFEVNGLHVVPSEPDSRGVVSLTTGNTVQVAALNGSFGVSNDHGVLLARVHSGSLVSFAKQAAENVQAVTDMPGMVSYENGHYYITSSEDVTYEITGKALKRYVGTKVVISGVLRGEATKGEKSVPVIDLKSIELNGGEMALGTIILIGGVTVAAAAGIAVWVYEANQSPTPASR
ncbi:hypothetical protein [Acidicapsa acidisoli]|uniref:hypothetical protein n=1 Tax=Acidicapsa acidisoli TaxID=1615681 RepID=UPI0021E012B1|nr:hypothetical protein [Acidicapsa acidisoli]